MVDISFYKVHGHFDSQGMGGLVLCTCIVYLLKN